MPDSTEISSPLPTSNSIFHKAASICVWSPLIAIIVTMIPQAPAHSREGALASAIAAGAVPVAGIVAGLVALCGIRKYGKAGILWKSVVGLLIWVVLAGAAIPAFLAVREKARKAQEQHTGTSRL